MTKKFVFALLAFALSLPAAGRAQSTTDLMRSLSRLQAKLDALTLTVQGPSVFYAALDVVETHQGAALLYGWGLDCSAGDGGTIEVSIDGVVVAETAIYRSQRQDVFDALVAGGLCAADHTTLQSGASALVDVSKYVVGSSHRAALRVYNAKGVSGKSVEKTFVINW